MCQLLIIQCGDRTRKAGEIPDGNQAFCTVVHSGIINIPNLTSAYAQASILTERQFIYEKVALFFRDRQQYKAGSVHSR